MLLSSLENFSTVSVFLAKRDTLFTTIKSMFPALASAIICWNLRAVFLKAGDALVCIDAYIFPSWIASDVIFKVCNLVIQRIFLLQAVS